MEFLRRCGYTYILCLPYDELDGIERFTNLVGYVWIGTGCWHCIWEAASRERKCNDNMYTQALRVRFKYICCCMPLHDVECKCTPRLYSISKRASGIVRLSFHDWAWLPSSFNFLYIINALARRASGLMNNASSSQSALNLLGDAHYHSVFVLILQLPCSF